MSHPVIRLASGTDLIEIVAMEYGTVAGQAEGDIRLQVKAQCDSFSGQYDQVWIQKVDWDSFIFSFGQLELQRTGGAMLRSTSPEEFELAITITNGWGHAVAKGCLSRYHFHPGTKATRSRIEYQVSIDPSMIRSLLEEFVALGSCP